MARDHTTEEPTPKKSNTIWWVLGCGGLFVIVSMCSLPFILCGGFGVWALGEEAKHEKAVDTEPGTSVTAEELTKAHNENSESADSKYKNKVLIVSGKVTDVDPERIILEPAVVEGKMSIGIICSVTKHNVSNVKVGDQVKVKGYFGGQLLGITKLEYCKLILPSS